MKKISLLLVLFLFSCTNDPIVYTLTATAEPAEGGQVVPEFMEYGEGDNAYVVATPSDEYVLESWSGDASGNANTIVIKMDKNKEVTANFIKKKYPLTIKIEGEGEVKQEVIKQGTVTDYNSGTIVQLTAEPEEEWEFFRWRGDITGNENPTQITIDEPKTVVAEFIKKKYPLTIEIQGEGTVGQRIIKEGTQTDYKSGTIVELEALSNDEWDFIEWSGDLSGIENPSQLIVDSPKTVKAKFEKKGPVYLDNNGVTIKAYSWAKVGEVGTIDGVEYIVVDRKMLDEMIKNNEDITNVCTTKITSMKGLFSENKTFNQDIGNWDVSNVINMSSMFEDANDFNKEIRYWDVSNVDDMSSMFALAYSFNQNIGNWDVSKVSNMSNMFKAALVFNQDISEWDVSNVSNMSQMFSSAAEFNQDIGKWDVSNVQDMSSMFRMAIIFNKQLGDWDVSNVKDMTKMFQRAMEFNQNISNWDVKNVQSMQAMFTYALKFNQNIGNWDVSNVTDFSYFAQHAEEFDQDISKWDVSNAENMFFMFYHAYKFNQDIGKWDVSKVYSMGGMFQNARKFNQDLSNWNVTNVSLCGNFSFMSLPYRAIWRLPKPIFTKCNPN